MCLSLCWSRSCLPGPESLIFLTVGDLGLFLLHPSVNKERTSQQIFVKSQSHLGRKELYQPADPTKAPGTEAWSLHTEFHVSPQTMDSGSWGCRGARAAPRALSSSAQPRWAAWSPVPRPCVLISHPGTWSEQLSQVPTRLPQRTTALREAVTDSHHGRHYSES